MSDEHEPPPTGEAGESGDADDEHAKEQPQVGDTGWLLNQLTGGRPLAARPPASPTPGTGDENAPAPGTGDENTTELPAGEPLTRPYVIPTSAASTPSQPPVGDVPAARRREPYLDDIFGLTARNSTGGWTIGDSAPDEPEEASPGAPFDWGLTPGAGTDPLVSSTGDRDRSGPTTPEPGQQSGAEAARSRGSQADNAVPSVEPATPAAPWPPAAPEPGAETWPPAETWPLAETWPPAQLWPPTAEPPAAPYFAEPEPPQFTEPSSGVEPPRYLEPPRYVEPTADPLAPVAPPAAESDRGSAPQPEAASSSSDSESEDDYEHDFGLASLLGLGPPPEEAVPAPPDASAADDEPYSKAHPTPISTPIPIPTPAPTDPTAPTLAAGSNSETPTEVLNLNAFSSGASTAIFQQPHDLPSPEPGRRAASTPPDTPRRRGGSPPSNRIIIWVAVGIAALLVLVGLFVLGTRLPSLLSAAPAPTPTHSTAPTPTPTPSVTPKPTVAQAPGVRKWNTLAGGECIDPFTSPWAATFTVVECAAPHAGQLVYTNLLSTNLADPYPGAAALAGQINLLCTKPGIINLSAAAAYPDAQLQGTYPANAAQWAAGQRAYYCFVSRSSGQPLTQNIAGPGPTG